VSVTNANTAIAPTLSSAILAIALVVHTVIGIRSFINNGRVSDFNRYYEIASTPGRPYVEYQVEHSIGTLLVFKLLGGLGGRDAFGYGVVALNALGDALIVAALIRGWGVEAAACYAVILVPVAGTVLQPRRCVVDGRGNPRRGVVAAGPPGRIRRRARRRQRLQVVAAGPRAAHTPRR